MKAASRCENKPIAGRREEERRRRRREERGRSEVCYMLQLRLWGLVCGSFMWQRPINHSCSLTGPLQHTHLHPRTHTNMHEHPHVSASTPAATYTEEHALILPKHARRSSPPHAHVHPIKPSSHPSYTSTYLSIHLSIFRL